MNFCGDSSSSNSCNICNTCQKVIRNKETSSVLTPSLHLGPSAFIPEEEIIEATSVHAACGGLDYVTQVMSLHPHYLQSFLRSQFYLLQMDGPLPLHWRHYIAIMAAARHQCVFLVKIHMQEFYQIGMCMEWLKGLHYAPQRLRNLNEINKILAHRPWLITKEHIQNLVQTGENSWTLAELVHAVVLLAHFHALASFVFGSGINVHEVNLGGCCTCDLADNGSLDSSNVLSSITPGTIDSLSELEVLMERMKKLQEGDQEEDASQEEMASRFEMEKKESLLVDSGDFQDDVVLTSGVGRFVEDASFGYQGFARHGDRDPPTLCAQDYCWEDHGFSLINRLYSDLGLVLDEKFLTARSLSYCTMASREGVNTSVLRRALFNYVHCMYGIRYDDYDYGQVNQLLERSLKLYIKTVTCYPERTTRSLYDAYWKQFCHSEKVHVTLLLMEARLQAELLYALRAITCYMT